MHVNNLIVSTKYKILLGNDFFVENLIDFLKEKVIIEIYSNTCIQLFK